ncbi:MAG: hypothetical protein ABIJ96_01815 [Elusimicrobiota bacterium]
MRKTLGIALAAALIFPSQASAELFNNLKVSGQLDIQSTSARNVADFQTDADTCVTCTVAAGTENDRVGNTLTRTLLKMEWDLLDDVHATIGLIKNDRPWGRNATAGDDQTVNGANQTLTNTATGTDIGGNVSVNLANIKIDKMFGHFDITLGRQYYGDPGDLIVYVGPYDTHGLYATSVDGMRVDAENDMLTFTGSFFTTAGPADISAGAQDSNTYLKGIEIGIKNMPVKSKFFVWNRLVQQAGTLGTPPAVVGPTAGGLNDNLYVFGTQLRGEAAGGWLSLDLAGNLGTDRISGNAYGGACGVEFCPAGTAKYRGWGFLVDTGYNAEIANVGGFTPWGTFGFGTGRSSLGQNKNEGFNTIATDFRPGVINRRFAAANAAQILGSAANNMVAANTMDGATTNAATTGLNNRVVWGAGANFTPAFEDRATVGVSFWDFRFQRVTDIGAGAKVHRAHAGNTHIGSEFGLTSEWRHSENVTLGMGWATFQPGGYIKEIMEDSAASVQGAGNNPVQMWFADFTVKF